MTKYYKPTMEDYERKQNNLLNNKDSINHQTIKCAEKYANRMKKKPSFLEKCMIEFLDNHNIKYQFQRIFYIKNKNGLIRNFYIVDFYIPSKKIILETDGSFHKNQIDNDNFRTLVIKRHYPKTNVLRWRYNDFKSPAKMKELLRQVA